MVDSIKRLKMKLLGLLCVLAFTAACHGEPTLDPITGEEQFCILGDDLNVISTPPPTPIYADRRNADPSGWTRTGRMVRGGEDLAIFFSNGAGSGIDLCADRWVINTAALDPTSIEGENWNGTGHTIPYGNPFRITVDGWWKTNCQAPGGAWGAPPTSGSYDPPGGGFWLSPCPGIGGAAGAWFSGNSIYARLAEPGLPASSAPDPAGIDFSGPMYNEPYTDRRVADQFAGGNGGLFGPGGTYGSHILAFSAPNRQFDSLTRAGNITASPVRPGKRIFELYNHVTGTGGFFFDPGADEDLKSRAWHGFTIADYSTLLPAQRPPSPNAKEVYIRFSHQGAHNDNHAGNYSNPWPADRNVLFTIEYLNNCPGDNGEFLEMAIIDPATGSVVGGPIDLHHFAMHNASNYVDRAIATGELAFRIVDDAGRLWDDGIGGTFPAGTTGDGVINPTNNTGYYDISVRVDSSGFTDVLNTMIDPVKELLQGPVDTTTGTRDGGMTKDVYEALVDSGHFVDFIRAVLALSVIFFSFTFMLGLASITQKELFEHIIKMAIVATLISENSWQFFYDFLFTLFIEGTEDLIQIVSGRFMEVLVGDGADGAAISTGTSPITDPDNVIALDYSDDKRNQTFDFLNLTMQRYFSTDAAIRIEALLFSSILGFVLAILIYVGIILFTIALLKAMILYVLSIIMVSLLLFLAPVFITFMLFSYTRKMFNNWLKNLISYSIQPVLLFTVLTIFNVFIFSAFYTMLSFHVCWGCLLHIDLPVSELMFGGLITVHDFDSWCAFSGYRPWAIGSGAEPDSEFHKTPVAFFMILIFIIFCSAMLRFIDWVVDVGVALTAGSLGNSLNNATNTLVNDAQSFAKHGAKIGLGAAGAGFSIARNGINIVTFGAERRMAQQVSDKYIRVKRKALKMMGARRMMNPLSAKGGDDGMGGKLRWKESLMTSKEKRELNFEKRRFNKLNPEEKRKAYIKNVRKQTEYEDKKADIRQGRRNVEKDIKKEIRQEEKLHRQNVELFKGDKVLLGKENKRHTAAKKIQKDRAVSARLAADKDKRVKEKEAADNYTIRGISKEEKRRRIREEKRGTKQETKQDQRKDDRAERLAKESAKQDEKFKQQTERNKKNDEE